RARNAELSLRFSGKMPASTVRSLMLVLLRWPRHDSQLAHGESASVSAAGKRISQDSPGSLPRASHYDRVTYQSVLPEPIEAVGAQLSIPHRMHDVAVAEECCSARVSTPSLASLNPQAWRSMCGWTGKGSLANCPVRRIIVRNQAWVTGPPRSVLKT